MGHNTLKNAEYAVSSENLLRSYTDKQIENCHVPVAFPEKIACLREGDFEPDESTERLDLRNQLTLTIDCDDTQDMDDACSLEETVEGYRLGVHIADVASYVAPGSVLDGEVLNRGTSIYLPDRTIPMLPRVLSDNLCSLNPNVDRRTISVLIDLDKAGNVKGYSIHKSLIRSAIKGIYSEVNAIMDGTADAVTAHKYAVVAPMLKKMATLASALRVARMKQGAHLCDDEDPKVTLVGGRVELALHRRGSAEKTIEEFMVLCNRLVGEYLEQHNLPGIYRTQARLGVLAEYETDANKHASLGVKGYVHFTSPIRRMSDLRVHQCLTMHLAGVPADEITSFFGIAIDADSEIAIKRQRRAKGIERACLKYAYSLYFSDHPDTVYTGRVAGADWTGNALLLLDDLRIKVQAPRGYRLMDDRTYSFMVGVRGLKRVLQAYSLKRVSALPA